MGPSGYLYYSKRQADIQREQKRSRMVAELIPGGKRVEYTEMFDVEMTHTINDYIECEFPDAKYLGFGVFLTWL